MELTFLGTGAAFSPDAFNASYILDRRLVIDAGSPVHVLLNRSGNSLAELEAAVITHSHADHTFGLPALLASRAIYAPEAGPFTVAGPVGFTRYIQDLLMLAWGEPLYGLVMERITPRFIDIPFDGHVAVAGFDIQAIEVVHVTDRPCQGYTFNRAGIRFGFSGDCGECPGLETLVALSDHFLVEMTGVDFDQGHLSRRKVVELVNANPGKRFYLTHLNDRTPVPGALIAQDLVTVELTPPTG